MSPCLATSGERVGGQAGGREGDREAGGPREVEWEAKHMYTVP